MRIILGVCVLHLIIIFPAYGHSPWAQHHVYRQKHLLILSARDDSASYPVSKKLVELINSFEPSARARPARAKNLKRAYKLLKTRQLQFALLSKHNLDMMRFSSGKLKGNEEVNLQTIYVFGDLEFVSVDGFPDDLAYSLTEGLVRSHHELTQMVSLENLIDYETLHPGSRKLLQEIELGNYEKNHNNTLE